VVWRGRLWWGYLSLREIFDKSGWKLDGLLCGFDTLPTLHGRTHRNQGSNEKGKGY